MPSLSSHFFMIQSIARRRSWVESENMGLFSYFHCNFSCQARLRVKVKECCAGLENWPHLSQKQEKIYCVNSREKKTAFLYSIQDPYTYTVIIDNMDAKFNKTIYNTDTTVLLTDNSWLYIQIYFLTSHDIHVGNTPRIKTFQRSCYNQTDLWTK